MPWEPAIGRPGAICVQVKEGQVLHKCRRSRIREGWLCDFKLVSVTYLKEFFPPIIRFWRRCNILKPHTEERESKIGFKAEKLNFPTSKYREYFKWQAKWSNNSLLKTTQILPDISLQFTDKRIIELYIHFTFTTGSFLDKIVTDDTSIFTVTTIMFANILFNAISKGSFISCAFHIIHMNGTFSFPKVCHSPCSW